VIVSKLFVRLAGVRRLEKEKVFSDINVLMKYRDVKMVRVRVRVIGLGLLGLGLFN